MIEIGKYNILNVKRESDDGLYLDCEEFGTVMLPKDEIPTSYTSSEPIEVFLYFDSNERVIPTTKKAKASVNEFSCLKVVDVSGIGAFLDWGLPKDLFVPNAEQKEPMEVGEFYVVFVYKDSQRNRLAASSKLDTFLDREPIELRENDKVDLLICHTTELGINAIINNEHWGLLYKDEVFENLEYGQRIEGYIKKIREDDKVDLHLHKLGYQKIDSLETKVIQHLKENDGKTSITDKSPPESISKVFGVSKKKYKMTLGSLYKNKRIVIEDDVIRLV
jgi:predicted RNA-binding protein (virulence factor B family)